MRRSNARALFAIAFVISCGRKPDTTGISASGKSGGPPDATSVARVVAPVSEVSPASPPGGASSGPAVAKVHSTRTPPQALPEAEAPFSGGVWASCYDHFVPSDSPRVDASRLGVACGPSTGLTHFEGMGGTVDESARPVVLRWEGKKRDCFRIFAAAAAPVDDLEVEIVERHGGRMTLSNRSERWVVAPEESPFCASEDGFFEARFATHAGRGELAAVIYRAQGMVPKKPRAQTSD